MERLALETRAVVQPRPFRNVFGLCVSASEEAASMRRVGDEGDLVCAAVFDGFADAILVGEKGCFELKASNVNDLASARP